MAEKKRITEEKYKATKEAESKVIAAFHMLPYSSKENVHETLAQKFMGGSEKEYRMTYTAAAAKGKQEIPAPEAPANTEAVAKTWQQTEVGKSLLITAHINPKNHLDRSAEEIREWNNLGGAIGAAILRHSREEFSSTDDIKIVMDALPLTNAAETKSLIKELWKPQAAKDMPHQPYGGEPAAKPAPSRGAWGRGGGRGGYLKSN
jgi:hypothetical protein